jgi:ABC-type nickel/cobalt efflux system permease component RcnA
MEGLDQALSQLSGGGIWMALVAALLLGLRHATDPDHLTAVITLATEDASRGPRRASLLGAAWGCGHAATLMVFGLPVVLFDGALPEPLQRATEVAVAAVIVALAVRLLLRWRRGYLHFHSHSHGDLRHAHPHMHERRAPHPDRHSHEHRAPLARSPRLAFGVGTLHGMGGSAPVALLVLASAGGRAEAAIALAVFAIGTAVSMAAVSTAFAHCLRRATGVRIEGLVPSIALLATAFGVWYGLAAI